MTASAGASGEPSLVLVVAADLPTRRALAKGLGPSFAVHVAEDADSARSLLRSRAFEVALVDTANAIALAADLDERQVVVLGLGAPEAAPATLAAGAVAHVPTAPLSVPWAEAAVRRAVELGLAHRRARASATAAGDEVLVAESAGMRAVVRTLRRAATGTSNVLLLGEPGSGVSLVARLLHAAGPRSGRPLREVSAAELNRREGDVTGGALEDGAEDLILDGVHELDREGQRALIALLAARESGPVGVRPRLVTTAHPSLRELAQKGHFRRELFHALATVLIEVPPLRAREEDLPVLAHLLLGRSTARLGRPEVRRVGVEAMRALRARPWPGNVTELAEVLDRAVLASRGEAVLASHLPFATGPRSEAARREADDLAAVVTPDLIDLPHAEAKERAVRAFDLAYAEAWLRRTNGNTTQAARAAGLDRSNFKRLLRRAREATAAPSPSETRGLPGDSK